MVIVSNLAIVSLSNGARARRALGCRPVFVSGPWHNLDFVL